MPAASFGCTLRRAVVLLAVTTRGFCANTMV